MRTRAQSMTDWWSDSVRFSTQLHTQSIRLKQKTIDNDLAFYAKIELIFGCTINWIARCVGASQISRCLFRMHSMLTIAFAGVDVPIKGN